MTGHRPEVADVFRAFQSAYLTSHGRTTSAAHRRVLNDLCRCRTAALGGHKNRCDRCAHEVISYNSCRNRHCPKCQARAQAEWLDARAEDLLEVPYFHVVFTLPHTLSALALQNKRLLYSMLFRAASETLLTLSKDPKHLGAQIGFFMVLHTWGQTLTHHPHVHAVVPGGGLSGDRSRWVSSRNGFFLPVRVLSTLFQKKFLSFLKDAFETRALSLHGRLTDLSHPDRWKRFIARLHENNWIVYAKPPFARPEYVLKYLARYTHRVAISNRRLVSVQDGEVSFRWRDYADSRRPKTMTLQATEFIRRFLLHVLPKGFVRIRSYGFLANRVRRERLCLCRKLLKPNPLGHISTRPTPESPATQLQCPACRKGHLVRVEIIEPQHPKSRQTPIMVFDTS